MLERSPGFAALSAEDGDRDACDCLRQAESIGRPLGDDAFLSVLEAAIGRSLRPAKRAPKPQGLAEPGQWALLSALEP